MIFSNKIDEQQHHEITISHGISRATAPGGVGQLGLNAPGTLAVPAAGPSGLRRDVHQVQQKEYELVWRYII